MGIRIQLSSLSRQSESYAKRPVSTSAPGRRLSGDVLSLVRAFGVSALQDVDNRVGRNSSRAVADKIQGASLCPAHEKICHLQTCPKTTARTQERHYADCFDGDPKRKSYREMD